MGARGWDRMLQEVLLGQEDGRWRMCCGCVMLNMTSREQAEPVRREFFRWYPTHRVAVAEMPLRRGETVELLKPMGMQRRRFRTLYRLSLDWQRHGEPSDAEELERGYYGMGAYGADSWRVFVEGRENVDPGDGALREHLGLD